MQRQNYKIIIFGCIFTCWQVASAANANTELSKMRDCTEIELEAIIDQDASREDNLARLSQQFFQSVNTIKLCDREQDSEDAEFSTDSDSASSITDADAASDGGVADNSTAKTNADSENPTSAEANSASASSEPMTATLDSENSTNIDTDDTATDSLASDMAATQNANQLDSQSGAQSASQVTRPAATPTASGSLVGSNFDQTMTEPSSAFAAPSASNMAGTTPQPTRAQTNTSGVQTDAAEQNLRLTNGKTPDDIPKVGNDSVFEAQIRAAAMAETDPNTKKNLWNEYRRYKGLPEHK
jgi:hypothetical protein